MTFCASRRWRAAVLCISLGGLALAASPAGAAEAETEVWFGGTVGAPWSGGADARFRYCLSDFQAVGVQAQQRWGQGGTLTGLLASWRLTIDALTFVPSVVVDLGGAFTPRGEANLAVQAGLVLAWRPQREWAGQVRLGVERVGLSGASTVVLSVALGRIWGPGDQLDFGHAPAPSPDGSHRLSSAGGVD